MRKTIPKEVTFCDECGKSAWVYTCRSCGVELCWDCLKKLGKRYTFSVYFEGSDDGVYCHACDQKLLKSQSDDLHKAYVAIEKLRLDGFRWEKDFKAACESANENLQRCLAKTK